MRTEARRSAHPSGATQWQEHCRFGWACGASDCFERPRHPASTVRAARKAGSSATGSRGRRRNAEREPPGLRRRGNGRLNGEGESTIRHRGVGEQTGSRIVRTNTDLAEGAQAERRARARSARRRHCSWNYSHGPARPTPDVLRVLGEAVPAVHPSAVVRRCWRRRGGRYRRHRSSREATAPYTGPGSSAPCRRSSPPAS